MKKLKIGLFGGSGKMGQQAEAVVLQSKYTPYLFVGSKKSKHFAISVSDLKNTEVEILNEVDVWIDFSSALGLSELLKNTKKTPVVSGTTGLTSNQFKKIKTQAQLRPVFWAPNLSVGLWSFRQALMALSSIADFDFAIEEIHHTEKKDKPSGTALTLRNDLERILNKKISLPQSQRLGGVYGIHTVHAASQDELISFKHQAINRKVFASGALRAAEWLVNQKSGFYTMDDMLLKRGNT